MMRRERVEAVSPRSGHEHLLSSDAMEPPSLATPPVKPVKVDNWGIYLLQRLHSFYDKGQHTDLLLRFPSHPDTISLHRLVFEASSDWLSQSHIENSVVDMPSRISPQAVRPVVTFMYTGKLLTGSASYEQIKETAELLRMSVLIKLIDDAQTRGGPSEVSSPKRKYLAPLRQIKRIKRIQRKFADSEKRLKSNNSARDNGKLEELNRVPGKKLPIWKKRSIPPQTEDFSSLSEPSDNGVPILTKDTFVNPTSEKSLSTPVSEDKPLVMQVPTVMYGRKASCHLENGSEKEGLFDQVLETGLKKVIAKSSEGDPDGNPSDEAPKTQNEIDESMRELLEEQRKRLSLRNEGASDVEEEEEEEETSQHDDDYLGDENDECFVGEEEDSFVAPPDNPSEPHVLGQEASAKSEGQAPKVVRFSLTPSANSSSQSSIFDEVSSYPSSSHSLDLATSIPAPNPSSNDSQQSNNNDKTSPSKCDTTIIKVFSDSSDKKKVISEVLRKNPNLLKEHRQVKLKIITRNTGPKSGVQYVTLRASDCQVNIPPVPTPARAPPDKRLTAKRVRMISSLNGEFRPAPKVMYTGRRGRPKQIKEGDYDPHEEVRQEIKQRLSENGYYGHKVKLQGTQNQEEVSSSLTTTSSVYLPNPPLENPTIPQVSHQPSSEAEAMSKVASDIAASINLVSPDFIEGSSSNVTPGSNFLSYSRFEDCHSYTVTQSSSIKGNLLPNSDPPSKEIDGKGQSGELDKVSALVLEWDEEEEIEEQGIK